MANLDGFNANNVSPGVGFPTVPPGRYLAVISASEEKATKSGGGKYLELTFKILEGDSRDRLVWSRLSLWHGKPTVKAMAEAELSAICHAVGVLKPSDSDVLHNIPLAIAVSVKPRDDGEGDTNKVTKYEAATPEEVAKCAERGVGDEIPI